MVTTTERHLRCKKSGLGRNYSSTAANVKQLLFYTFNSEIYLTGQAYYTLIHTF